MSVEFLRTISQDAVRVENSGLIKRQIIGDYPDGVLKVNTVGREIPFQMARIYTIDGFGTSPEFDPIRGAHAHKTLDQVIFCLRGSFTLKLDDGKTQQEIRVDTPDRGIRLGPMLWHDMIEISHDCLMLVVASQPYDEADYIRNYDEFKSLAEKSS